MLKFIRKYQLLVLVVGGSLLMVVFLLQPVLTRLAPSPAKARVASIGPDGKKITSMEREKARFEFQAVGQMAPMILSPQILGIDAKNPSDHWLLLAREAEQNGFIGENEDGLNWIPELARTQVRYGAVEQLRRTYGNNPQIIDLFMRQPDYVEQMAQTGAALEARMIQQVNSIGRSRYGVQPEDVQRALSKARGIQRMLSRYQRSARVSTRRAQADSVRALDAVMTDVLIITPDVLRDTPDPTDAELAAHFDRFKAFRPGEGDLGVGYTLPPRIQLEYLVLDPAIIGQAVAVDRVEMNKLWRQDREKYAGEFADEAANIEADLRAQRAQEIMNEADRIMKGEVFNTTRGLDRAEGGIFTLPENWDAHRPSAAMLAQAVVDGIRATGVELPLPPVKSHGDQWLTQRDLSAVARAGRAIFTIGTRKIPLSALPAFVHELTPNEVFTVQVGVPLVEIVAVTDTGSRIYVTVLGARGESPAEDMNEVGIDRVERDYQQVHAYERLVADRAGYLAQAQSGGLEGVSDSFKDPTLEDVPSPVRIQDRVLVRRTIVPGDPPIDPRVGTDAVRTKIVDTALERLGPLEAPESVSADRAYMVFELPKSRSLALVKLIARRPLTAESYRNAGPFVITRTQTDEIREQANFQDDYPFSYESMKRRHEYVRVKRPGMDDYEEVIETDGDDTVVLPEG